MKVAVVKYNAGNIRSVDYALKRLGVEAVITADKEELQSADKVIFPEWRGGNYHEPLESYGTGRTDKESPSTCIGNLSRYAVDVPVFRRRRSRLFEYLRCGRKRFVPQEHEDKVPHMGWNTIGQTNSKLFEGFTEEEFVYFVHSFYVPTCDFTAATTDYIHPFSAALHKDNFYATQFHPEKSGKTGEKILTNFLNLCR